MSALHLFVNDCDLTDFEINFILLIEPFCYKTKKLNVFRTNRAFELKQNAFFIILKELSFAKNYLRVC